MNTAQDIEHLIARMALQDRAAFNALYNATSAKLFGVCLRVLKNRQDAEEALQEIYIKIWHKSDQFAANDFSPLSWLVVIARNHCIDVLRARKPASHSIDELAEQGQELRDEAHTPEQAALNSSLGRSIANCLEELDIEKAAAVRQAYVDGYSYNELAEVYKVPLNTMRTWLRRSLASLKECMQA